jgi:ribosomal-protein-alanine N-acetyltransferase
MVRLVALTYDQLQQYLSSPQDLADDLGFPIEPVDPAGSLFRAINIKLSKMAKAPERDHLWYTYWLIVPHLAQFGAGQIGFKGIPNQLGEAEIGYGIGEAYQRQGYMTEAVRLIVDWAFRTGRCKAVTAETRPDNIPSQRVLQKIGMRHYADLDEMLLWRIDYPSSWPELI